MSKLLGTNGSAARAGEIDVFDEADRSRIVLRGEVDASMNAQLASAFTAATRRGLPADVDTRGTTFIDSTVIAGIAHLARTLPAGVTLIDPPEHVRFLLHVTEVEQLVMIADAKIVAADDVPDLAVEAVQAAVTPAVPELPDALTVDITS